MATTETRADRKERYHRVLRTIGLQTDAGNPGIRVTELKVILCSHAGLPVDGVERTVRAALENDDLVGWRDDEGRQRLTLATKGDLRNVAAYWVERDGGPDLGWINSCIDEVRDDEPFHRRGDR